MKTMSIQTGRTMSFEQSQTLSGTAGSFPGLARGQARLAQWLPAPPARALPAPKTRSVKKASAADSLWMPLPDESLGEKAMIGLLIMAASIAIGGGLPSDPGSCPDW